MSILDRVIWEGWTVQNFIDDLEPMIDMIMNYESFIEPFKTKKEISKYIRENQEIWAKIKGLSSDSLFFIYRHIWKFQHDAGM